MRSTILRRLFKVSGMLDATRPSSGRKASSEARIQHHHRELQAEASPSFMIVWSNDYRFASEDRFAINLKKTKPDRRVKGDILKAKALALLECGTRFHDRGVFQWDLIEKVRSLLTAEFPPPARIELIDDGWHHRHGHARHASTEMETIDRINLIWDVLDGGLTAEGGAP